MLDNEQCEGFKLLETYELITLYLFEAYGINITSNYLILLV